MDKELVYRTLAYLIGYYKTHEETIINKDEIDAINFIIEKNETLEQELQKYKSLYENEKNHTDTLKRIIKKIEKYMEENNLYNYKYDEEEMFEIVTDEIAKKEILNLLKEIK